MAEIRAAGEGRWKVSDFVVRKLIADARTALESWRETRELQAVEQADSDLESAERAMRPGWNGERRAVVNSAVDEIVKLLDHRHVAREERAAIAAHVKTILSVLIGVLLLVGCGTPFTARLFDDVTTSSGSAGGGGATSSSASSGSAGGGGATSSSASSGSAGGGGATSSSASSGSAGGGGATSSSASSGTPCAPGDDPRCCAGGLEFPEGTLCQNGDARCCGGTCGALDACAGVGGAGRTVKIRLEIDFFPPDEAFEHLATDTELARRAWATGMIQRAFPYLRGAWFDVTILPEAPDARSAEPAVAVPDEALVCPAHGAFPEVRGR